MSNLQVNQILVKDCVQGMQCLDPSSVDIVVTSPPYNLGIDYGVYQDQQPRQQYLSWLDAVMLGIKHCLKDTGHFWLNVGYSNLDPWVGMDVAQVARKHFVLQNNITWVKSITINDVTTGHFKPINSERFANPTWEHVFHFTKTGTLPCDRLSIGVPYMWDCNLDRTGRLRGKLAKKFGFANIRDFEARADPAVREQFQREFETRAAQIKPRENLRCRGNTWYVPYDTIANREQHRGNHPATFPVELVENCIKFSGIKSGLLLDPFMGSGTSAVAALNQGLDYLGFDLDPNYVAFAQDRVRALSGNHLFDLRG